MKRIIAYLVCFLLMISVVVFAEIISVIKEYTYQASELDSKTSCRAIALEQVKRELLEELGTYVESTTVVQNAQIEQDEIRTISAGVVQTKVLDESWDGNEYWIKAEVSADPDEVAASIEEVRNDQKLTEELAESEAEKEKALQEIERLQGELAQANADKEKLAEYNQAVNQLQASDSYQQGTALTVAGDYEGAIEAYDRVLYLRHDDPKAYFGRSIVFIYLGNYQRATEDLDRAMVIRPAYTNVYFQRASAYKQIRETRLVNDPHWVRKHPRISLRPVEPKQDTLQRYLDKKQSQHKLVKVNPFQPRPAVKRDPRQVQPHRLYIKREKHFTGQSSKPDIRHKGELPTRDFNQRQERPGVRKPFKPEVNRNKYAPAPVGSGMDAEHRGIQRRDFNEEQRRNMQLRKRELDDQKRFDSQQRRDFRKKERPVVQEPFRPDVGRQVNVPPPPQPRIERVQKKEIKQEKKKSKQRKKDHVDDDENPGRR